MLQQTQVKTVIPYWERWMRELPNVASLARASSERIHRLWEGLGYYTRVRNMQKAARAIMEEHETKFPCEFDAVLALPGIGRYTAGAICSIAFNTAAPILDGNVMRVLTRVFGIRENPREKETNTRLWTLAEALVRSASDLKFQNSESLAGACSALNQSLMELGATVCTPQRPRCGACPIATLCVARRKGIVEQLPNLGERISSTARHFAACLIENNGAILVRRRPDGVVNSHLWEFPNVELGRKNSVAAIRQQLEAELACSLKTFQPLATVKHTITRYRIRLDAFRGELNGKLPRAMAGKWIRADKLEGLPFTSAHRRVLKAALKNTSVPLAPP